MSASPINPTKPGTNARILAFVPAYRCAPQIRRVLAQFDKDTTALVDAVLVIDNQSPDGTVEAALHGLAVLNIPGKIIVNRENYGLGGSQKAAFLYAAANSFDYVIVLHGDDQADIRDFVPLLTSGAYRNYDSVLGSRFAKGSRLQGYSWARVAGNRVFNFLFSAVSGMPISDLGSGLNIYKVRSLQERPFLRFADDLTFNYYMILDHAVARWKVRFEPISWREEDQLSNVRILQQTRRMLRLLFRFAIQRKRFLFEEHRSRPRDSYPGDVVYENNVPAKEGTSRT